MEHSSFTDHFTADRRPLTADLGYRPLLHQGEIHEPVLLGHCALVPSRQYQSWTRQPYASTVPRNPAHARFTKGFSRQAFGAQDFSRLFFDTLRVWSTERTTTPELEANDGGTWPTFRSRCHAPVHKSPQLERYAKFNNASLSAHSTDHRFPPPAGPSIRPSTRLSVRAPVCPTIRPSATHVPSARLVTHVRPTFRLTMRPDRPRVQQSRPTGPTDPLFRPTVCCLTTVCPPDATVLSVLPPVPSRSVCSTDQAFVRPTDRHARLRSVIPTVRPSVRPTLTICCPSFPPVRPTDSSSPFVRHACPWSILPTVRHKRLFSLGMGHKGLAASWSFAILHPCLGLCSCSRSTVRTGTRWDTREALAQIKFIASKNSQQRRCGSQATCIQQQEGRLAAGEKSLQKAPPRMHCCQPYGQSRSRRVLSTVATWSEWFMFAADALQACLGRLDIEIQLRRAVRWKAAASEPQCTTCAGIQRLSSMCKIKNTIKV